MREANNPRLCAGEIGLDGFAESGILEPMKTIDDKPNAALHKANDDTLGLPVVTPAPLANLEEALREYKDANHEVERTRLMLASAIQANQAAETRRQASYAPLRTAIDAAGLHLTDPGDIA